MIMIQMWCNDNHDDNNNDNNKNFNSDNNNDNDDDDDDDNGCFWDENHSIYCYTIQIIPAFISLDL